jgi:hypothetical protein
MSATSVTGKGLGAAKHKGPKNGRNNFVPLLSPRVITAGVVTLSGGTATVTFPAPLTGDHTKYAVVVTAASGSTLPVVAKTNNSDSNFVSFTITGGNVVHNYIVVSTGVPFVE